MKILLQKYPFFSATGHPSSVAVDAPSKGHWENRQSTRMRAFQSPLHRKLLLLDNWTVTLSGSLNYKTRSLDQNQGSMLHGAETESMAGPQTQNQSERRAARVISMIK
jgi:hypothetical protein